MFTFDIIKPKDRLAMIIFDMAPTRNPNSRSDPSDKKSEVRNSGRPLASRRWRESQSTERSAYGCL